MENKWWTLVAVCAGMFMLLLDVTIVVVAQPSIQAGLHASFSEVQWTLDAYALTLAALLLISGVLADRYGRRLLFAVGLSIFTLGSLLCGLAVSPLMLILSRIGQGIGGAIMFATSLALLGHSFRGRERGVAFGVWGAVTGIATALGPVLGGLIIAGAGTAEGWRWVFLVNVLIGAVAVPMAAWQLPHSRSRVPRRFDPVGLCLLSAGLILLLVPLVEGQQEGWPAWCYVCLGASAIVLALLALWEMHAERRGMDPLLKPSLFAEASFSAGAVFAIAFFAGFTSVLFTISILWQEGLGRSALTTGLLAVPFSVGSLVSASISDKLSAKMGRMVLVTGCAMVAAGIGLATLAIHLSAPIPGNWSLVGPLLLAGLGNGIVVAPNQDFVLARVPEQEAGTAGATLGTAQRLGSAIGIAIIGTVLFGNLDFQPGPNAVASAFSHGSQLALLVNVAFVVVALFLVMALPRQIPSRR